MEADIRYEDLLTGDPIFIRGIGHIRSPKLKEMNPSSGIGWDRYSSYVFFLKLSEEQLNMLKKIERAPGDSIYNCIVKNESMRELYQEAFSFFISERVVYDDEHKCFLCFELNDNSDPSLIGVINDQTFDDARAMILTSNYIPLSQADIKTKHSSKASEAAWNKIQQYLAKQTESAPKDETMTIGNMISKLCAIHPSINILNVFELTVFQFYDAFFQSCFLRSISFSEAIVSNHGSKDFKYEDWLKPVKNN